MCMKPATQPTKNGLSSEGTTVDVEEVQQASRSHSCNAATALGTKER